VLLNRVHNKIILLQEQYNKGGEDILQENILIMLGKNTKQKKSIQNKYQHFIEWP
jgi:hypothetical protein